MMASLPERAVRMLREDRNFGAVATLMPDGSPQVTVVWVDTDGQHVIFNTAEGRAKLRNLRRDPRVAITVVDARDPYRQLLVRGRAVEVTQQGADEHIDRLAQKYLGVERYPYRRPGERRVIVKVVPEWVRVT